jgi:hypothetical protein
VILRILDVFLNMGAGDLGFIRWSELAGIATGSGTILALLAEECVAGGTLFFSVYVGHVV